MDVIYSAFQWVTGLGGGGILAIALFLLGLLFRVGFGKAVRSAITSAVGFIGLFLVVDILTGIMGPATAAMVARLGWQLEIVDVGWGLIGMAWGAPVAPFIIITAIALNVVLILSRFTKTLMIDFWNYWSFCAAGALAYGATQSIWFSVLTAAIYMAVCWKVADLVAKNYRNSMACRVILAHRCGDSADHHCYPVIKLLQRIPVIKDINVDPEHTRRNLVCWASRLSSAPSWAG